MKSQNLIEHVKKNDTNNDIFDMSIGVCNNFTTEEIQDVSFILQNITKLIYCTEILNMSLKNNTRCGGILNDIKKYAYYIVQQAKFLKLVKLQNNRVYSVLNTIYEQKLKQFENTVVNISTYYTSKIEIFTFVQRFNIDLKLIENVDIDIEKKGKY